MTKGRYLRTFDYVNHPYERVRDALLADPGAIFREATRAAESRAHEVASALRVNLGGIDVGTEIAMDIETLEDDRESRPSARRLRLGIRWEAARHPRLFPEMNGELAVYPLTAEETQLDFDGTYDPPLGALGDAIDAVLGHRIAEASVHRFVSDVASFLRRSLDGDVERL